MTGIFIRVTAVEGSAPRGAGTSMWVTEGTISGTIGGGALEFTAIASAREMLAQGNIHSEIDQSLGPDIGQCCGGRVHLVLERLEAPPDEETACPIILIFGAGHVGCALTHALALLPLSLTVIDQRAEWLSPISGIARTIQSPLPEAEVRKAPPGAAFIILTHDHALDFLIAEAALARGDAAYVGMIGSDTKRARLVADLRRKGISSEQLTCPIGAGGSQDKRPAVIAAGVAAEVLRALL